MAAETTIQTLGLGTFEQQGVDQAPPQTRYIDYWDRYSQVYWPQLAGETATSDEQATYDDMTRTVSHIAEAIIDRRVLRAGRSEQHYVPALTQWDQQHGNFNRAVDTKRDLLRAASITLQESGLRTQRDPIDSSRKVVIEPGRSVYSVTNRYPITTLLPNHTLLLAGQLINKAAWLEPDPDRQQKMFTQAELIYEQLVIRGIGTTALRANHYLQDIRLYRAQETFRESMQHHNQPAADKALRAIHKVMYRSAKRLVATCELYEQAAPDLCGEVKGNILEQFGPLALWAILVTDHEQGVSTDTADHFAIRHAFTHEDRSPQFPTQPKFKPSFDMVVQRFDDEKLVTTPVEFKFGKYHGRRYLPGIALVHCHLEVKDIGEAAQALVQKYHHGSRVDWRGQLPTTVTDFCDNLQEQSLGAS